MASVATCRLCLGAVTKKDFVTVEDHSDLVLRIKDCVSVEIEITDTLPKTVCTTCIQKVNDWYDFKQMCITSNKKLKIENDNKIVNENIDTEFDDEKGDTWTFSDYDDSSSEDSDQKIFIKEEDLNKSTEAEPLQTESYPCSICDKQFDGIFEYLDHQDEHTGQPVFNCDKCNEVFTSRQDIVTHERHHKIPCSKCGKMVRRTSMKIHLIQHTDRYVCPECSHRFNSGATLKQHIITMHTNIKDHVCESCGKSFSSKTAMNVHLKTHRDERPYSCKLCSYTGRTASSIYIHMATHAQEIHSCEMCPKTFKSWRNLGDHLRRVHSKEKKHECTYCNKKFVDKYMLNVHVRTHTGLRPYQCKLCDKAFIRSDSLKEHMMTHGSRKVYECNQCMKKFTTRRGHARHICSVSKV